MKINIGCGKEVRDGFDGLDIVDFGQSYTCDVRHGLPFKDGEINEVYSRHLLPCLTKAEINEFFNELYRVMEDGASFTLILPAWNANGGYGHPHFITEIREGFFYFLSKEWRETNAPEVTELNCNFETTWGYNMHPSIVSRNTEYQQFALANYCNSALDIVCTLKKKVLP